MEHMAESKTLSIFKLLGLSIYAVLISFKLNLFYVESKFDLYFKYNVSLCWIMDTSLCSVAGQETESYFFLLPNKNHC